MECCLGNQIDIVTPKDEFLGPAEVQIRMVTTITHLGPLPGVGFYAIAKALYSLYLS